MNNSRPALQLHNNMTRTASRFSFLGAVFVLLLAVPYCAIAGKATDQLNDTVTKLTDLLANTSGSGTNRVNDDRLTTLASLSDERFDFAAMAESSLGNRWARLSADERREFVEVFTVYALRSYNDALKSQIGASISFDREIQSGDTAEVDTSVVTSKRAKLSINYKLHLVGESWKVYDVDFEHMSVLKNYRSQFKRVIERTSFNDLIQRMKEHGAKGSSAAYPIAPIARQVQGIIPPNSKATLGEPKRDLCVSQLTVIVRDTGSTV